MHQSYAQAVSSAFSFETLS